MTRHVCDDTCRSNGCTNGLSDNAQRLAECQRNALIELLWDYLPDAPNYRKNTDRGPKSKAGLINCIEEIIFRTEKWGI